MKDLSFIIWKIFQLLVHSADYHNGQGQAEGRSLEPHIGLPNGCQGSSNLNHHQSVAFSGELTKRCIRSRPAVARLLWYGSAATLTPAVHFTPQTQLHVGARFRWVKMGVRGQAFGLAFIRHCVGYLHPMLQCQDLYPGSISYSGFLLIHILATSRWWLKCLDPYHPSVRPRLTWRLLA